MVLKGFDEKSDRGSALVIAVVFTVVFLLLLSVIISMYLYQLKLYTRYLDQYESEVVVRDIMAVTSAEQLRYYADKSSHFVKAILQPLGEVKGEINKWLSYYPLPTEYADDFPKGAFYWGVEDAEEGEEPNVLALSIVSGRGVSQSELADAIENGVWPLPDEYRDRKTFAQFQVVQKDLGKLGNTANYTLDYGPYARLDGDVIFRGSVRSYFTFWGVLSNVDNNWGSHSDDWRVYNPQGEVVSSSNYRRMVDTALLGKLYFGGDDFYVGDKNYSDTYYGYTDRFSETVDTRYNFSGISILEVREENQVKDKGYFYYYDPAKDLYKAIVRHTSPSPHTQYTNDVFFKNILLKGAEVDSQFARDITEHIFGSGAWNRLEGNAINRAKNDNNYFRVNSTNIAANGSVIKGGRNLYNSGDVLVTFYTDSNKHTHMIISNGGYDYYNGFYIYDSRKIYDVDLTDVSGDGKKILLDLTNYDTVYIIPPCALDEDGDPVWDGANINGNPVCEEEENVNGSGYSAYEVNGAINPQARDTSLNPNWQYEWTHYVYPWKPSTFHSVWSTPVNGVDPMPYHANWQNMNMYAMKITIAANNVYLASNLVPLPEDGILFEQDLSIPGKDILPYYDLPNLDKYPGGEIMAMYVRDDFRIMGYTCGENNYYSMRDYLFCRGSAMYGFRFAADTKRYLSPSMFNYGGASASRYYHHAWDTLFYSHMLSIEGTWGLDTVDGSFPYTMENFRKMGTLGQGDTGGPGMISTRSGEGHQGYFGNRYYLIASNPYSNPPAYWIIPPAEWRSVTVVNYRMGR